MKTGKARLNIEALVMLNKECFPHSIMTINKKALMNSTYMIFLQSSGKKLLLQTSPIGFILPKQNYHEATGDILTPSRIMGISHMRDPRLNKVG